MNKQEAIDNLLDMSLYAGERFDLVQAGGGNTSVKYGGRMLIKASGFLLSEMQQNRGYTEVNTADVLDVLDHPQVQEAKDKRSKDTIASQLLKNTIVEGKDRPSIETYLHALLYRYTCHVHAIAVNVFTSQEDWEDICAGLFPGALLVPYDTPGIELAITLRQRLQAYHEINSKLPKVVLLQNHGLIISSDNYDEIEKLMEEVVIKAENSSGLDLSRYRGVSEISRIFEQAFNKRHLAYLSEDLIIQNILADNNELDQMPPFSPDGYVFCGYNVLRLKELDKELFLQYEIIYKEPPKLILYKGHIYVMAADLKKAKMIEDVFKNNLLIASQQPEKLTFLSENELRFLGNWEAEKYRQDLS